MSPRFETDITHLKVGAQKNIVNGPAGCLMKAFTASGRNPNYNARAYRTGTIPNIFIINQ